MIGLEGKVCNVVSSIPAKLSLVSFESFWPLVTGVFRSYIALLLVTLLNCLRPSFVTFFSVVWLCIGTCGVELSTCLPDYLSVAPYVCLSLYSCLLARLIICLSLHLSICLCIAVCIFLSFCLLSICQSV